MMNRQQYIAELRKLLSSIPAEERDAALKYYEEYFDDAGDDEEAINSLGSVNSVAQSILDDQNRTEKSSTEYVPANPEDIAREKKNKQERSTGEIILIVVILVLTFPLWISVASAAFSLALSIIAAFLSIILAIAIASVALIIAGFLMIFAGIPAMALNVGVGLISMGIGFFVLSIGSLLLIPTMYLIVKAIPAFFRGLINLIRKIFRVDTKKEVVVNA